MTTRVISNRKIPKRLPHEVVQAVALCACCRHSGGSGSGSGPGHDPCNGYPDCFACNTGPIVCPSSIGCTLNVPCVGSFTFTLNFSSSAPCCILTGLLHVGPIGFYPGSYIDCVTAANVSSNGTWASQASATLTPVHCDCGWVWYLDWFCQRFTGTIPGTGDWFLAQGRTAMRVLSCSPFVLTGDDIVQCAQGGVIVYTNICTGATTTTNFGPPWLASFTSGTNCVGSVVEIDLA